MNPSVAAAIVDWAWILWAAVGFVALVGLVALVSPRHFAVLSRFCGQWVSTRQFSDKFDSPIDVDRFFIRHSRLFGAVCLATVVTLGYFAPLSLVHGRVYWPLTGFVGAVGVVALLSPHAFSVLAGWGGKWVDTSQLSDRLDRPIAVDHIAIKHSRLFGTVLLGGVLLAGYLARSKGMF